MFEQVFPAPLGGGVPEDLVEIVDVGVEPVNAHRPPIGAPVAPVVGDDHRQPRPGQALGNVAIPSAVLGVAM